MHMFDKLPIKNRTGIESLFINLYNVLCKCNALL